MSNELLMPPVSLRYFLRAILGVIILIVSFTAQSQEYQSKYERDLHTQAFQYLELKEFEYFGVENPVSPNTTEETRQYNRRVEILVEDESSTGGQ
ncbi:hypothetical protein N9C06_05365 [Salibacteraceae bacterium]|nr:hypothetical protein [Salibacteraceae bacterium]